MEYGESRIMMREAFWPPSIFQTAGSIFDPETSFECRRNMISENAKNKCLKVTVDVKDEVKIIFLLSVFAGSTSRVRLKQSWWKSLDRVWDTAKNLPKSLVTSCQVNIIRSNKVKKL